MQARISTSLVRSYVASFTSLHFLVLVFTHLWLVTLPCCYHQHVLNLDATNVPSSVQSGTIQRTLRQQHHAAFNQELSSASHYASRFLNTDCSSHAFIFQFLCYSLCARSSNPTTEQYQSAHQSHPLYSSDPPPVACPRSPGCLHSPAQVQVRPA